MCDEPKSTKSNLDLSLVGGLTTKRTGFAPPCEGGVSHWPGLAIAPWHFAFSPTKARTAQATIPLNVTTAVVMLCASTASLPLLQLGTCKRPDSTTHCHLGTADGAKISRSNRICT